MTGKVKAVSKEPDRKTWIINDDHVHVTKDADNEEDDPANEGRDRRTQGWRRNKLISQWWEAVPRDQ